MNVLEFVPLTYLIHSEDPKNFSSDMGKFSTCYNIIQQAGEILKNNRIEEKEENKIEEKELVEEERIEIAGDMACTNNNEESGDIDKSENMNAENIENNIENTESTGESTSFHPRSPPRSPQPPQPPLTEEELQASALSQINSKLSTQPLSKERRAVSHCKSLLVPTHYSGQNLWILKPSGLNRGRGVHMVDSVGEVRRLIKEYTDGVVLPQSASPVKGGKKEDSEGDGNGSNITTTNTITDTHKSIYNPLEHPILEHHPNTSNNIEQSNESTSWEANHPPISNLYNLPCIIKTNCFVIQKYIERPLLIRQRKFDIRIWVLVAHDMKVYFFREGYLRTSGYEYSTEEKDWNKREIHLTNNAVQKYSNIYGQFEDGNQLSFRDFQTYLDDTYPEKAVRVKEDMVERMKDIVNLTMQAVRKKLNPDEKHNCFELFGYDFMVDIDMNLWLIEINTNPCLEESSSLLKSLLPRMIGIYNIYIYNI